MNLDPNFSNTSARHQCPFCSYSTNNATHIKDHRRIHTGERPYVCNICSKSFVQKSYFTVHMRHHTGERPFSCFKCKKTFIQKSHLNKHKCFFPSFL